MVQTPDETDPPPERVWHVIPESILLAMLRRCHAGEDPDIVYAEGYANAHKEDTT